MYRVLALGAAARRASEIRREEREELADMITSKIVKAWNRGRTSGG